MKIKLIYLKESLFSLIVTAILLAIFLNAELGFSLDYQYYTTYFNQIINSSFTDLLNLRIGPYVFLESSAGVEIGFVIIAKVASILLSNSVSLYAAIAICSLLIKVYVLRNYRVGYSWVLLICIYSGILLESNALRSGLALSFFLLSFLWLEKEKKLYFFLFSIIACSVHLQSIPFIIAFSSLFYISKHKIYENKLRFIFFAVLLFASGFAANALLKLVVLDKLSVYISKGSSSAGFNSVSILSFLAFNFVAYQLFAIRKRLSSKTKREFFSLIYTALPMLSIYMFLTSVSAVGDRLWQWGIIIFSVGYLSLIQRANVPLANVGILRFNYTKIVILTLLFVCVYGITIRYPLSNFLYPIIPYVDYTHQGF